MEANGGVGGRDGKSRVAAFWDSTFSTRPIGALLAMPVTVPVSLLLPPARDPKKGGCKTICRRFQRFIVVSRTGGQTDIVARAVGPHHWHLGHGTRPNPVPGTLPGGFGPASYQHLRQLPTHPHPTPSLQKQPNKLKGGGKQKHLRIRKRVPLPFSKKSFQSLPILPPRRRCPRGGLSG